MRYEDLIIKFFIN